MTELTTDTAGSARRGRTPWLELLALTAYGVALFLLRPLDPFEWDEVLFQRALDRYDVAGHSPHPPGYPLYVAVAKGVRWAVGDPQLALQLVAIAAAMAAVALTWLLARRLGAPRTAATLAAAVLAVVPGFAFNGNIGMSDVPGVAAAVGVALLFVHAWERPWLLVVAAATAGVLSGVRVAGLMTALPMAAVAAHAAWRRSSWRPLLLAPVAFAVGAAAVWVPAMVVTGPERFLGAVQQQAEYIHRAWVHMRLPGAPLIVTARAWGAHWLGVDAMAGLLWALVLAGGAAWWLNGRRQLAILGATGAGAFLLFCAFELEFDLAMRYALPAAPLLAILASGVAVLPASGGTPRGSRPAGGVDGPHRDVAGAGARAARAARAGVAGAALHQRVVPCRAHPRGERRRDGAARRLRAAPRRVRGGGGAVGEAAGGDRRGGSRCSFRHPGPAHERGCPRRPRLAVAADDASRPRPLRLVRCLATVATPGARRGDRRYRRGRRHLAAGRKWNDRATRGRAPVGDVSREPHAHGRGAAAGASGGDARSRARRCTRSRFPARRVRSRCVRGPKRRPSSNPWRSST